MNSLSLNACHSLGFPPCLKNSESLLRSLPLYFGWCLSCCWQSVPVPAWAQLVGTDDVASLSELIPSASGLSTLGKEASVSQYAVLFYRYQTPDACSIGHSSNFMKLPVFCYFMFGDGICAHLYFWYLWPLFWSIKTWHL